MCNCAIIAIKNKLKSKNVLSIPLSKDWDNERSRSFAVTVKSIFPLSVSK